MSNKVDSSSNLKWEAYGLAARNGMIFSGMLLMISGVALGVIFGLNYHNFFTSANYPLLEVLGGVGALALTTFVVASVIRYIAHRKTSSGQPEESAPAEESEEVDDILAGMKQPNKDAEPAPQGPAAPQPAGDVEPIDKGFAVVDRPPAVSVEKVNVEEIKTLVPGLIQDFENLLNAIILAYLRSKKEKAEINEKIKTGFDKLKSLVTSILNDNGELVRIGIFFALEELIDSEKLLNLGPSRKKPEEIIYLLPSLIEKYPEGRENTKKALDLLFKKLATQKSVNYEKLKDLLVDAANAVREVREANEEYQKTSEAKKLTALKKKEEKLSEARKLLFNFMVKSISFQPKEIEILAQNLIPEFMNFFKGKLFVELLPEKLAEFMKGYQPGGKFSDEEFKDLLSKASLTDAGWGVGLAARTFMEAIIKRKMNGSPLNEENKAELRSIIDILLPALVNMIWDITQEPGKPIYKETQKVVEDATLVPPQFKHEEMTWKSYLEGYQGYLAVFTDRFNKLFEPPKVA